MVFMFYQRYFPLSLNFPLSFHIPRFYSFEAETRKGSLDNESGVPSFLLQICHMAEARSFTISGSASQGHSEGLKSHISPAPDILIQNSTLFCSQARSGVHKLSTKLIDSKV